MLTKGEGVLIPQKLSRHHNVHASLETFQWYILTRIDGIPLTVIGISIGLPVFIEDRCCPNWWVHFLKSILFIVNSRGIASLVQSQRLDVTSIERRGWYTSCVPNFITIRQTALRNKLDVILQNIANVKENTWHRFVCRESIMLCKFKASNGEHRRNSWSSWG